MTTRPSKEAAKKPSAALLDRIKEHAVRHLPARRRSETNLHIDERIVERGAILAHRQKIAIDRPTVVVFADDAPRLNWAHPCRYLLYDAKDGQKYKEVKAQFPPHLVKTPASFRPFHTPIVLDIQPKLWYLKPWLRCPVIRPRGRRYAVLFAGAANNRHTNDLEFLYRTLRDFYHFRDEDIYVLNYDGTHAYNNYGSPAGTTWPGDGTAYRMPVWGEGTKADLDQALDELKGRLKKDDLLLIHTNNHGGYDGPGQAYLCAYSGADYYAADFAAKLAELPVFEHLVVMMEQCHAGGFNDPIVANSPAKHTSVASACLEPNNSIGGADFDPFARDWIAAMAGNDPYGGTLASDPDTSGEGAVSAREAFDYADSVHHWYDTPVYDESSATAGAAWLGQRYSVHWWYCLLLRELLQPYYLRLPIPEFHARVNEKLLPRLEKVDRLIEGDAPSRKAIEQEARRAVVEVFGKR